MKSFDEDGGESQRQWHRARRQNSLKLTGELPKDLCRDEITLTICCRYAESLLKNPLMNKYLAKQHPTQLRDLQQLLADFQRACHVEGTPGARKKRQ